MAQTSQFLSGILLFVHGLGVVSINRPLSDMLSLTAEGLTPLHPPGPK